MSKRNSATTRGDARAVGPLDVVTRFIDEVINGGDIAALPELWAEDMVWHGGSLGEVHGIDAYGQMLEGAGSGAFTGMRLVVDDIVAAGEKVVVRFTNGGTQTGPFMGFPATDRAARWLGIGIYEVHDGLIQEAWFAEDILGMLLDLGAIVLPGATG
jgi:predicted ester cyclase